VRVSESTSASDVAPADRHRTRWRVALLMVVAVHLAVLYVPRAPSSGGLPLDKVVHAVIFGMVLWVAARAGLPVRPVAVLLAAHAVVSELIQHYLLPGRSGDPADSLADLIGVLIVTVVLRRQK
jgi:VanZ family protein